MTTVATLVAAKSADTLRAELLAALVAAGFPVASWQPGAVPRSLVYADATALARLHSVVAELAMAAFLDDATGDWLSLFAASRFQVARTAPLATSIAASSSPWTTIAGTEISAKRGVTSSSRLTNVSKAWRTRSTGIPRHLSCHTGVPSHPLPRMMAATMSSNSCGGPSSPPHNSSSCV